MPSYNKLKEKVLENLHSVYLQDEAKVLNTFGRKEQISPVEVLQRLIKGGIYDKQGAIPEQKEKLINEFKQTTWEEVTENWIDLDSKRTGRDRNIYYERD